MAQHGPEQRADLPSLTVIAEGTGPASGAGAGAQDMVAGGAVETRTLLLAVHPKEALGTRWDTHTHTVNTNTSDLWCWSQ